MKPGDRVRTPLGHGIVRGFDDRTGWAGVDWVRQKWVIVELDKSPGSRRWVAPEACEPSKRVDEKPKDGRRK